MGSELDTETIKSMVKARYGNNRGSIIPSDYCYNITSNGIKDYSSYLHLFEQIKRGVYKYLGVNYPYNGMVYNKGVPVGEWINGKYSNFCSVTNNMQRIIYQHGSDQLPMIDKDRRMDFLLKSKVSGSSIDEIIRNSTKRAYDDLKRTLRGFGSYQHKVEVKLKAQDLLNQSMLQFLTTEILDFSSWHKILMFSLIETFHFGGFNLGKAQKWVNMSFKYLYCFTAYSQFGIPEDKFKYCHTPIDNYVMINAENWYGIPRLPQPWSTINDYHQYIDYQAKLKDLANIKGITQLELDFELWHR